jgi:molybdopterin-guanine dinucleotide biosynthesis protein A
VWGVSHPGSIVASDMGDGTLQMVNKAENSIAIVLAGGRSSRFGTNKALAQWNGVSVLEQVLKTLTPRFAHTLIVSKDPAAYRDFTSSHVSIAIDQFSESHSLGGVYSGLVQAPGRRAFVTACDMPLMRPALIDGLFSAAANYAAAIPVWGGRRQPLCGVYAGECAAVMRRMIEEGRRRLCDVFDVIPTRFLLEDEVREFDVDGRSFSDIDTREQYDALREKYTASAMEVLDVA